MTSDGTMKRAFIILGIAVAAQNVRAAGLPPESFGGAAWGALIGGLSGSDCHNNWSNDGAWIGAGIGFLTGTLVGESRRQQSYNAPYAYPPPAYGYGYSPAPTFHQAPPSRPNYVLGGTFVGAASGAMIGEGTSNKPWEGAAIGAAAGLVVGGVAEHNARKREATMVGANVPQSAPVGAAPPSPWQNAPAPRHQIPDAPRVPDAPTF